jgi:hypothetical protein
MGNMRRAKRKLQQDRVWLAKETNSKVDKMLKHAVVDYKKKHAAELKEDQQKTLVL